MKRSSIAKECVCCSSNDLESSPAIMMPFISHRVFNWRPVEIDESWGLRTIPKGMAYSICNSFICKNCHHLFMDYRFDDEQMANLYNDYRQGEYVRIRDHYEPGYKEKNDLLHGGVNYVSKIESFLEDCVKPEPSLLDWGGDTGKNTPFQSQAKVFHIYEISDIESYEESAQFVSKEQTQKNHYDLIVCSNVLEHTPYPADLLEDIKKAMNKDTTLYIEVPYEDLVRTSDDLANLHKKKKHWHEHINFYNPESMRQLLISNGFEIVKENQLPITGETSDYILQVACRPK